MEHIAQCGHGFKRELPPYRGVRLFEMNCGEVRCSLSERDYFQPEYVREWIDAALKGEVDGWAGLDLTALKTAQRAAAHSAARTGQSDAAKPKEQE